MKVAFILRKFPVLSETFIIDQIVGLLERGFSVDIYSLFKSHKQNTHLLVRKHDLLERTHFPPVACSERAKLRLLKAPQLFFQSAVPVEIQLRSLNSLKYGRQALFLNLLYFSSMLSHRPRYDILHCHFGMYGLIGVDLRDLGLISGKVVTSFHGMDVNSYPKNAGKDVYNRLFQKGEIFTVNSHFTARKLNELGCPENCISILPAGVDLDRFQDYSRQRPYDKTTKVLSVGRLVECKGLEFGIEAVSRLKKHHPALEYWIVGDGPRYDQLKLLIDSLDAGHYVKLLGAKSQEDLKQIYRDAQIFILPSIVGSDGAEEGQGLVLLEAQSSGLPVITTKIGGIPESIVDGETGFLVPQKDSNALAEKLNFLISHPERCQQLGARGRGFVEEKFGQDRLICQLEGIYREMIEDD